MIGGASIWSEAKAANLKKAGVCEMATIEGIRIKNFRSLKDITFGKLWSTPHIDPLTPLTVVIGKNGAGKKTDMLVFYACDESGNTYLAGVGGRLIPGVEVVDEEGE